MTLWNLEGSAATIFTSFPPAWRHLLIAQLNSVGYESETADAALALGPPIDPGLGAVAGMVKTRGSTGVVAVFWEGK